MWRRKFVVAIFLALVTVAIMGLYTIVAEVQKQSRAYEESMADNRRLSRIVERQERIIARQQVQIEMLTEAMYRAGLDPTRCTQDGCERVLP